jgi:hypothetical protein
MRRHRYARRMRALAGGYFWTPCPMCGEYFGGGEWVGRISLPTDHNHISTGICPACELDLGAAAAPLCEQYGHTRLELLGESGPVVVSEAGLYEISLSCRLDQPPIAAHCSTCGIDLPVDSHP